MHLIILEFMVIEGPLYSFTVEYYVCLICFLQEEKKQLPGTHVHNVLGVEHIDFFSCQAK